MLRFEKHIINGLYQNIALSQSYVSLCQKSAFSFVNRRKGLTKHERAVHVTAEYFDRLAERQDAQEKKRLKRKGIEVTDETPITPAQQFARNLIEKMREDPIKFSSDDNLVFDKERGLIGRKDVIGDVEKFVQSQEWKDLEAAEQEEEEKEQKKQLKKSTKKETKVSKEEGDNSEGLFDEWEQDPSREKLSHSEDGGGRKVKKQQTMLEKQEAKKQESKKPKFKDIFRQFSDEPLDQIESEKQVGEVKQQDYSNRENIRKREEEKGQKSRPARDSLEDSQAFENNDRFDRAERTEERKKRNKKSARFEEENNFNGNEQDIFENIAEHRKEPEKRREFQSNKDVERKPKERKESQKSNESFQSFLDEFAAEPIGDLKSKKASNKTDPEEEEDEFFLEDVDKFDQPTPKRNLRADNRDREVKTQQKPPAKNNLQQFYSDLSEEKVQKIQRRLEIDDNIRDQAQGEYIGQSQRQSSQITNYETFKKSLEKRKSLERFYFFLRKFDTDNLIKILSYPNLIDKNPTEQIPKFLILLNYIRKNKLLQNYDRDDIHKVLEKIISHINDLRYTEVSTLAVLLDQMRINRADYFREIEKRVIEDAEKFSIRTLSNIIYSFGRISTKQSITEDFSELFAKMETIIALRVKNMNGKDISQVMVGYSKSQNFSPELLYVLEQACLEKYDMMQTKELSVIAHTFAKNDHFSADFFDKLRVTLMRDGGKFKMMELALVMEALERFKLIDQSVLKELERQFARRADQSNIQDIAIFFKVLTRPDYRMAETTAAKMSEVCNVLFNNIDANCLYKMFNNFAEKFDKGNIKRDMAELMIRRFKMLIKTNAIRGIHFTEIKTELFKVKDENIVRRSKKALQEEFAKKDTRKSDNRRQNNPEEY